MSDTKTVSPLRQRMIEDMAARKLTHDPRRLGARIGITAVLHTWGSALTHHPHCI